MVCFGLVLFLAPCYQPPFLLSSAASLCLYSLSLSCAPQVHTHPLTHTLLCWLVMTVFALRFVGLLLPWHQGSLVFYNVLLLPSLEFILEYTWNAHEREQNRLLSDASLKCVGNALQLLAGEDDGA